MNIKLRTLHLQHFLNEHMYLILLFVVEKPLILLNLRLKCIKRFDADVVVE